MRMYDLEGTLIALDHIVSVSNVLFDFRQYNQLHTIAALTDAPTPPMNVDEHARFAIHTVGREQAIDIIGTREHCTKVRDALLKAMAMDDAVQAGDNTLQHAIDIRDAQIENLRSLLVTARTYMKHANYCCSTSHCVCGLDQFKHKIDTVLN